MKAIRLTIFFLALWQVSSYAQSYQGPASGSVSSGVTVTTGSFADAIHETNFRPSAMKNVFFNSYMADYKGMPAPTGDAGSNYMVDPLITRTPVNQAGDYVMTNNFVGIPDQGFYIPPDPYIAVGPTHLVSVVNSRFRILTKTGTVVSTIEAASWFSSALPGCDPFDPKVLYDHYAKRWVMVWLHLGSSTAYYLVSVSDDSIPTGTWYNWALPSHVNGSVNSGNWGDYQGVGYDDKALYITSNQFTFSSSYNYVKLRIIPKTDLYVTSPGVVNWKDLWDLRTPNGEVVFGTRPVRAYNNPSEFYLVSRSPFVTGTYFTVHKVLNPLTTPSITAVNVPVVAYADPNDAGQLGGSQTIDGGGSNIRNEPVYRNGKIYLTHSVKSGTGGLYSSVRYVVIDVASGTAVEDKAMGADNYFHTYPAIEVDPADNIVLTYTRSGTNEYAGAYYTTRPAGSLTLSGSKTIKAGSGYYYKTFGGTRNRWGDYNGIWLDPSNPSRMYALTEYVASTNTWGSWIAELTYSTSAAVLGLTSPNGGEVYPVGSTQNITWSSSNVTNVKLEYSTNNGSTYTVIAASLPASSGTYSWNVPATPSTQCLVRVSDAANPAVNDVSDAPFTIGQPAAGWVSVTSGTTGDIWGIDWVDANTVWISASNGDVKRSTDGGNTFIAAGNAGDGAYSIAALSGLTAVVATGPSSGNGVIKRTTDGGATWTQVYTASGAWFNFIDNVSSTTLWAQSDPIGGNFHIVKSTDGGATWSLASNLPAAPASNVFGANNSFYRIGGTAWFGCGGASGATQANRVYKSTTAPDGPWTFGTTTAQFSGSLAFSAVNGNGVVGFWSNTSTINRTTNGGTSFTAQSTSIGGPGGFDYIAGTDMVFAATTTGLFRSTNNGVNWSAENIPTGVFNLQQVKFYNNDITKGLCTGAAGVVLRSQLQPVIPVELTSFTASSGNNYVELRWTTSSERNNRGFEVQKNINGEWITLGFVNGRGTSTEIVNYSFTDDYSENSFAGTVSYRLRQIDFDGRAEYSSVVALEVDFSAKEYLLEQNYPNPFNPSTTISFAIPANAKVRLAVFDQLGREVAVLVNETLNAGRHSVEFNAQNLSSGVYYYTISADKFTATRKLLLMK